MKIINLKKGQFFRTGKQKLFRQFLEARKHNDKLLVYYNNCKEMFCDVDATCEVLKKESVEGFGKGYSTSLDKIDVEINGFKTQLANLQKDNHNLCFVYCIKNQDHKFVQFDVRNFSNFTILDHNVLLKDGLKIVYDHVKNNESSYFDLIVTPDLSIK